MFSTRKVVLVTAALLTLVAGTGCAGQSPSSPPSSATSTGVTGSPVDVLLVDCSPSFRPAASSYLADMIALARDSAQRQRSLWAGCFDGAPLRTLRWAIKTDFGAQLHGLTPEAAERFNQARAIGLRGRLAQMIDTTPTRARGSGLLEALEVASEIPDLRRLVLFTDALSNEADGLQLATATPSEIRATVVRWQPRLSESLHKVRIVMVGVGRGASRSASVRNARLMFGELVAGAGGSLTWTQTLSLGQLAKDSTNAR